MSKIDLIRKELKKFSSKERAKSVATFFKTEKGQYGEGDLFIGVSVPDVRKIVKEYAFQAEEPDIQKLISSKIHEYRLCGLLILVSQYEKADDVLKEKIANFYLNNIHCVNNWDLVDLTAYRILGVHLVSQKNKNILNKLVVSKILWERRIAVVSTYAFIKRGEFDWIFSLTVDLLSDKEDLMHKACGWMLREVGKKDEKALEDFLQKYLPRMPRTMLRYAIEKFPEKKRKTYLQKP